jgi:hypothetical protein
MWLTVLRCVVQEGVLVMEENRDALDQGQLEAMILRDRNHASVIMWSLCNEVACPNVSATALSSQLSLVLLL